MLIKSKLPMHFIMIAKAAPELQLLLQNGLCTQRERNINPFVIWFSPLMPPPSHSFPSTNNFRWEQGHVILTVTTNCIAWWTSVSRLPHWYCRLVTEEWLCLHKLSNYKGTGNCCYKRDRLYYWNTGKLYQRAGMFCIFLKD